MILKNCIDGRFNDGRRLKIGNDANDSVQFSTEVSGCLGLDCANCFHCTTEEPVKTGRVKPKRDSVWLKARNLVFQELLNLRDNLTFYHLSGNDEKLEYAINQANFLIREVDTGYLKTIAKLTADKNKTDDTVALDDDRSIDTTANDSMNLFENFKGQIGIRPISLSGWHPGDIIG